MERKPGDGASDASVSVSVSDLRSQAARNSAVVNKCIRREAHYSNCGRKEGSKEGLALTEREREVLLAVSDSVG